MAKCPAHEDDTASLAIKQDHNKILLHCFGHCHTEAILRAKNLTWEDLFVNRNGHQSTIVATYPYHDLTGKVRYRKHRTADKRFWLERSDGHGGWIRTCGRRAFGLSARRVCASDPPDLGSSGRVSHLIWSRGRRTASACGRTGSRRRQATMARAKKDASRSGSVR